MAGDVVCKIAGAFFVLGSTGYFAVAVNQRMDERSIQLRKLYSILLQLKSEIQYMNNPLPECFEKMGQREKEPFQGWLVQMADRMKSKDGAMFSKVWEEETWNLYEKTALKQQDVEPLVSLKDKLGTLDVNAQIKAMDYCVIQIERNRKMLEEEIKQQKKMVLSISLFVGFMTLIILI